MALYQTMNKLGNQVRRADAVSLVFETIPNPPKRTQPSVQLKNGDNIILGFLPAKCNVLDIRVQVLAPVATGTMLLGFAEYIDGEVGVLVTPLATVVLDTAGMVVVPMPVDGVLTPAGDPYIGDRGSISVGKYPLAIVATYGLVTPLPPEYSGRARVNMTYEHFQLKTGEYVR